VTNISAEDGLRFVSPERYLSPKIGKQERERLWPKVWLMAGRLEQLPSIGSFFTFDIDLESFVIVRVSKEEVRAYYNVCSHRGRRLKSGAGHTGRAMTCPFHGWRFSIQGELEHVVNIEDWEGCRGFSKERLGLQQVKVDTWGGWVFISMNPQVEPLLEYLAPVPEYFQHYEFEKCRIAWGITIRFPCNWKAALNAFNENYHVETTHPQLNKYGLSKAPAKAHGKHSQFLVGSSGKADAAANLGVPGRSFKDLIETIQFREQERRELLNALVSDFGLRASQRLRAETPADATPQQIIARYRQLHREEMEAAGAHWPANITSEDVARAGVDWHVFPNFIFLPSIDGALHYRSRPDPYDVEHCFYDIWWIQRYGEGAAPAYEHKYFHDLESAQGVNPFLEQDFSNMLLVQRGMHSRGFRGAVYNPLQEVAITNFEKQLDSILSGGELSRPG
jgi:phenylpropionate dioxygenase-like ring-hydroxylating dioxygenase large terminal subunit